MYQVSLGKVEDYTRAEVKTGMERLLSHLGGMRAFVRPGDRVLLKPNMLSAKPPEAAVTTHPEVVRAAIELVREAGGTPLVGDSPGVGRLSRVAEASGILAVLEETGTELVEFCEPQEISGGGLFKRYELARAYLEADRVINLPKLKTHGMMTLTCCVKNLFGAVVGTEKVAWHLKAGDDRGRFARMLLEIYLLRKPDLNIVDAIVAMEGDGPSSGDPRRVGLLLAGINPIAVDRIVAEVVGMPGRRLYVERAAEELDMDGSRRETLQTVGFPLEEAYVRGFQLPPVSDVQLGVPRFLVKKLRHLLTAYPYPIVGRCRQCGICCQACPPGAMELHDGMPRIDYKRCIRCFCCRELCPVAAFGIREGWLLRCIKKYI